MIHLDHNHTSIPGPADSQNHILPNSPHWSSPGRDGRPFYQESQEQFLSDSSKTPAQPDNPTAERVSSDTQSSVPAANGAMTPAEAEESSLHAPSTSSPDEARSPPPDSTSSLTPPPDAASPNHTMDAPAAPPEQVPTDDGGVQNQERSSDQAANEVERASRQSTPLSDLSSAPETAPDDENGAADGPTNATEGDGGSTDAAEGQTNGAIRPRSSLEQQTQSPMPDGLSSSHTSHPSAPTKASPPDPKVVSILELNSLLLRVTMDLQARGITMNDPNVHQYSLRLQSNLTWLAAAADDNHKVSQNMMVLPMIDPPPVVEVPEMPRILQIYRELPTIFAKQLARRQQVGALNGNAKRERAEEAGQDGTHKRRDTGETKVQIPGSFPTPGAGPSTPHPPSQILGAPGMSAGPVPRLGSPSMPPPPVPSGALNEAQLAAARARQAAQMRQIQAHQQHVDNARQMSPPSGMPMNNVAGPSSMSNIPNLNPQQMAVLTSMGPQAVQAFQLLQTPNHPFVQFLLQQIPGFMQLPLQDKLQRVIAAQNMMRQRQHQQGGGSGMSGLPQGGMQGPLVPQHSGDGSPSRMSPVSQQSPMQPSYPPGDPRSMLTPQQQQTFASLNPHQRQLWAMQQQMLRGGGGGGSGMNPQMMNQQQMMQERMRLAQAQAAGSGSSPNGMGSPMIDGPQFAALRSNPGMPGIARSARTPSDSVPSPVSQQRMSMSGQSPEEQQQRAMMIQQAQAQAQRGMASQMQNAGFGGGGGMSFAQMQGMGMGGGGGGGGQYGGMGSPPGSAGGSNGGGSGYRGGSPAAGGQMWGGPGGGGQGYGGGPFMAPSPSASQHDGMTPGRQASATPAPHQQMGQNPADSSSLGEMDFFNWGQAAVLTVLCPSRYFASRPDLFGNGASGAAGKAAAASVVQQVLSSPAVPATNGWKRPDPATTAEIGNSVGRVAAAAAALRASNGGADPTPGQSNGFPRPPPRRNASSSEEPASPPQEHAKLLPQRKFGDVDMSSGKNMFSSIRNSTAAKHAAPAQIAPPTPPAFQRKNDFAPPPRRVPSTSASSPATSPAPPAPPALPRRNTQDEGEWVEALYDYHSEDPGDLDLQEGMRVLVVERTSDDWWTGEIDGQRGLIPAAYVKVL
ncbi:hypothetical protein OH76DRAFT_1343952 [Lentinus brumalis]|uniref:SH3 domain-containing protein n=1 Tax=Lentinus brumalis TaxID=2498619 RepID=A0A371DK81_9APHY|nr:hypothetical protein OH76DRAFT_1343952 [Polyporus brumalis]